MQSNWQLRWGQAHHPSFPSLIGSCGYFLTVDRWRIPTRFARGPITIAHSSRTSVKTANKQSNIPVKSAVLTKIMPWLYATNLHDISLLVLRVAIAMPSNARQRDDEFMLLIPGTDIL